MKKLLFLLILVIVFKAYPQSFSIEGHRGARGWLPENTIPSFLKALEMGADTIELDVVVSQDNKLVVSHEPWFSSIISLDKKSNPIPASKEKEHNIYKMSFSEVKLYDVGSLGNKNFPMQQKIKVHKPLLRDVFKEVKKYAKKNKLNYYRFNIEIKSNPDWDNIFTPAPAVFAGMVYDEILKYKMQNNVIVQSFDVRQLQEFRKFPLKLPLALLVGNRDGIEKNLAKLGFQPDTYSPHFSLLDKESVDYCRQHNIKIVPWTVNEPAEFEKIRQFDLDGVITDFPDRAVQIYRKK